MVNEQTLRDISSVIEGLKDELLDYTQARGPVLPDVDLTLKEVTLDMFIKTYSRRIYSLRAAASVVKEIINDNQDE